MNAELVDAAQEIVTAHPWDGVPQDLREAAAEFLKNAFNAPDTGKPFHVDDIPELLRAIAEWAEAVEMPPINDFGQPETVQYITRRLAQHIADQP